MMDIAFKLVLALHILSLVIGMGSGVASSRLGPNYGTANEDQKTLLNSLGAGLSKMGHMGLALLWITGIAMIFMRGYDIMAMPTAFYIKLALVIILSGTIGMGSAARKKFVAGDIAASTRVEMFGRLSAIGGVLVIIAAVFSFN